MIDLQTTQSSILNPQFFRIGHGYDSHRFVANRKLILGGVEIPYNKGMLAHSDGDVVIHAICDALLGAAALDDIGQHFPDTAKEYKAIDSRVLLRHVAQLIDGGNYQINNIDVTILAEQPKLKNFITAMRTNIATDLKLSIEQVSIKATTNEGMGFIGRGEGIAVQAVTIISSQH